MKKKITTIILLITLMFTITSCEIIDMFLPQEVQYRVTFYNEGIEVKSENVKENSLLSPPTISDKEGYDFVGWFKDINDKTTGWNFQNDKVTGNLRLDALWELKKDYINVNNFKIEAETLVWDELEEATYEITFLDKKETLTTNYFSLANYKEQLKTEKTIIVKPIKAGFIGIDSEVKVKFKEAEVTEGYRLDFEPFDYSDFKELNRQSFKTSTINDDDHNLVVAEARLTNTNELPKNDVVALILRSEGVLELQQGYDNFHSLEFNLGNYKNNSSTSTLKVYFSNYGLEWKLFKDYNNENNEGFSKFTVKKEEIKQLIDLNKLVYIKFEADIKDKNIVIDDIVVYQDIEAHFKVTIEGQIGFLTDYYKSAEGLKGEALVKELRIIVSTNLNAIKYKDYKEIGELADINPTNSNKVRGIYDLKDLKAPWGSKSEWHREHVWPNSRLGMARVKETEVNQGSDPHNLRAIYPAINSARSNRYYDVTTDSKETLGHTLSEGRFYPGNVDKGDVARILMYMVIRYEFLGLTDSVELLSKPAYTKEAAYMGKLSVLLDWHNEDAVDKFEINRNNSIFSYQNNRNPFVDHPELFSEVFAYYLSLEEERTAKFTLYLMFEVDYSELIKNKENIEG